MGPLRTRCLKDLAAWHGEGISLGREGVCQQLFATGNQHVILMWSLSLATRPIGFRANFLLAGMQTSSGTTLNMTEWE